MFGWMSVRVLLALRNAKKLVSNQFWWNFVRIGVCTVNTGGVLETESSPQGK